MLVVDQHQGESWRTDMPVCLHGRRCQCWSSSGQSPGAFPWGRQSSPGPLVAGNEGAGQLLVVVLRGAGGHRRHPSQLHHRPVIPDTSLLPPPARPGGRVQGQGTQPIPTQPIPSSSIGAVVTLPEPVVPRPALPLERGQAAVVSSAACAAMLWAALQAAARLQWRASCCL